MEVHAANCDVLSRISYCFILCGVLIGSVSSFVARLVDRRAATLVRRRNLHPHKSSLRSGSRGRPPARLTPRSRSAALSWDGCCSTVCDTGDRSLTRLE